MSPRNVPTSTSITIASPWGSSRSSTACASAKADPVDAEQRRRRSRTVGRLLAREQPRSTTGSAPRRPRAAPGTGRPSCAATSSPPAPRKPARRTGSPRAQHPVQLVQADQPERDQPSVEGQPAAVDDEERGDRDRRDRDEDPRAQVRARRRGLAAPARSRRAAALAAAPCGRAPAAPASAAPEAAPARGELGEALLERLAREVGPQLVAEDQLGVRADCHSR